MYKLIIAPCAKKQLKNILKKTYKDAIINAIEELKEYPYIGKKLARELKGKYSYRIGVYRIIYKVNEKDNIILILTAGHRSKIYD